MQSIRKRIMMLTVIVIIAVVAIASAVAVLSSRWQENVSSERLMSLICETSSEKIDRHLASVEQSVNTIASYVDRTFDVVELSKAGVVGATGSGISLKGHDFDTAQQQEFDDYIERHGEDVASLFLSLASQNEGVLGYYYRVNLEISRQQKGFLYSRKEGGDFTYREPTDLRTYASNDYEHVGWYYLPQERGKPTWVGPYFDPNQQVDVVSFVAPLYMGGTFIGVVGIDIEYESLVSQIKGIEVLSSGYAFLTDEHGQVVYHPSLPSKMSIGEANPDLGAVNAVEGDVSLTTYTYGGVEKRAAWETLDNGMRLFVCAPVSEVNARWYGSTLLVVLAAGGVVVVLLAAMTLGMRRITKPLEDLTVAASRLAEGNYDVNLTYEGNDEVGILTNSFRNLVENIRMRVSELYNRAYRDALTGVKNKAAYDAYSAELDAAISTVGHEGFAVIAFDCNELKRVNDTYGHDKGDAYLKAACGMICRVYDHSPVFRVGGDEFSCILTESDYRYRDELEQRFRDYAQASTETACHEWQNVNVAMGMAVYDPETDRSVNDVARRADDLMYKDKNEYKQRKAR